MRLFLSLVLVLSLTGCGALITAATLSGKVPDSASILEAAVRTGRTLAAGQAAPEGGLRTIEAGQAVSGTLTEEDEQLQDGSYFSARLYDGAVGERIRVDLWSEAFAPVVILGFMEGGIEGTFEQLDAVGGDGSPATLTRELERTGTYVVVASTLEPGSTGAYRMRVMSDGETAEADAAP